MIPLNQTDSDRASRYTMLLETLPAFLEKDTSTVTILANVSALLNVYLDHINWVGFYLVQDTDLTLGPFQGLPACTRIMIGEGVCGTAAKRQETVIVEDVSRFPGHIACDAHSVSEIVVPLIKADRLLGVIDVDSPQFGRFGMAERDLLQKVAAMLVDFL